MIDVRTLKDMDRSQLIELAGKLDVKVHHKSKDETIRRVIAEQVGSRQMNTQPQKEDWEAPKPVNVSPAIVHSKEDVLKALSHLVDKKGFKITFPEDGTVIFDNHGVTESITLSAPMHIIKRTAAFAAQTKYAPSMIKDGQVVNKNGSQVGVMMFG